jgi:hypothetical protein
LARDRFGAGRRRARTDIANVRDATSFGYALLGLALALGGAALAYGRARAAHSFYAADVYHLTARSHRRFAGLSAIVAGGFGLALRWTWLAIPLLALYVLALVLYLSSFARGFSDDDD